MKVNSSTQQAIVALAKAMATTFKKFNRPTREKALDRLCSPRGKKALDQLADNPNRSLNQFPKLAFREWITKI